MCKRRTVAHWMVVRYTRKHPDKTHGEIAVHFHLSRRYVSTILARAGVDSGGHAGRPLKPSRNESELQFYWENVRHKAGLGMDRGLRINGQRIFLSLDNENRPITPQ
jgi:hypothetical protein